MNLSSFSSWDLWIISTYLVHYRGMDNVSILTVDLGVVPLPHQEGYGGLRGVLGELPLILPLHSVLLPLPAVSAVIPHGPELEVTVIVTQPEVLTHVNRDQHPGADMTSRC